MAVSVRPQTSRPGSTWTRRRRPAGTCARARPPRCRRRRTRRRRAATRRPRAPAALTRATTTASAPRDTLAAERSATAHVRRGELIDRARASRVIFTLRGTTFPTVYTFLQFRLQSIQKWFPDKLQNHVYVLSEVRTMVRLFIPKLNPRPCRCC